jgi:SOS-response transcriptional repressor LexA
MYNIIMNKNQAKILELSSKRNILNISLRELGRQTGIKNPATVKYHLEKLKQKNLIIIPEDNSSLIEIKKNLSKTFRALVRIPILGRANCGTPIAEAEEIHDGFLQISPKLLPANTDSLFALRAEGNSMNRAHIKGANINDGDYVVIDSKQSSYRSGDYVLSIIDGCANIKKIFIDSSTERIVLLSESTAEHNPIYIHKDDNYLINGRVVLVIKNPAQ